MHKFYSIFTFRKVIEGELLQLEVVSGVKNGRGKVGVLESDKYYAYKGTGGELLYSDASDKINSGEVLSLPLDRGGEP